MPPVFRSSVVTLDAVREHLREMNSVFEETSLFSQIELYAYLLNLASKYETERSNNFAKTVHLLHPRTYLKDRWVKNGKSF